MPTFTPPTVEDGPRILPDSRGPGRALMRHYSPLPVGVSVLKIGGVYTTVRNPTTAQIDAADVAYLGGHEHPVTDDEAADLTAAGFGSNLA